MIRIREVTPADAPALRDIYAHYVENTAVSFEYTAPDTAEFASRIAHTLQSGYPYLAAEEDGRLLGYLYAGRFRLRRAYDVSAESSIYLAPDARRRGIGSALYAAAFPRLRAAGVKKLYACIAFPPADHDPFLSPDSKLFHEKIGFSLCGHFHACAEKFGRTYDMVYMEYTL